jgi:hypothetical protein
VRFLSNYPSQAGLKNDATTASGATSPSARALAKTEIHPTETLGVPDGNGRNGLVNGRSFPFVSTKPKRHGTI